MIRKLRIYSCIVALLLITGVAKTSVIVNEATEVSEVKELYEALQLQQEVSFRAFFQAMEGYKHIKEVKNPVLTLIDFSKPSTEERMYVIDMQQHKLLFKSLVAHGKNSGGNYATSFSNRQRSHQSSLGFYLTEQSYQGRNGLSLILNGLEKGINDNAKARAVVIHGADYCNPKNIASAGRLGRSFGCPALPLEMTKPIIEAIKDGSLLYVYSDKFNADYLKKSKIL
jgi:hypothetical protein